MKKLGICILSMVALSIQFSSDPPLIRGSAATTDSGKVSVRVWCDTQRVVMKEPLHVRVEVWNRGDAPLIFPNLVTDADHLDGHIEFHLIDSKGRESARMRRVADSFAPYPREPNWQLLLGRWVVLYPGYSMTAPLDLSVDVFPFLNTPGIYKLKADYSSGGLSDPENYRPLGLSGHELASLPFSSWSGKIESDSVSLAVVPAQK
jgi:hypothetical protein